MNIVRDCLKWLAELLILGLAIGAYVGIVAHFVVLGMELRIGGADLRTVAGFDLATACVGLCGMAAVLVVWANARSMRGGPSSLTFWFVRRGWYWAIRAKSFPRRFSAWEMLWIKRWAGVEATAEEIEAAERAMEAYPGWMEWE